MKEVNWMMDTLTNSVEELYILYHKDIVRFFAEHLADREAAWELCHEVFVRLLLALASGIQLTHPQRWLMRVAKNLLIDTYRHQQTATATTLPLHSREVRCSPVIRRRSGHCLSAQICCKSSWRPSTPYQRSTSACSSGVRSSGCLCRRSLCVLERRKQCSQPSYGGHASSSKGSTSDGGSRIFFPQTKRFLGTLML